MAKKKLNGMQKITKALVYYTEQRYFDVRHITPKMVNDYIKEFKLGSPVTPKRVYADKYRWRKQNEKELTTILKEPEKTVVVVSPKPNTDSNFRTIDEILSIYMSINAALSNLAMEYSLNAGEVFSYLDSFTNHYGDLM